MTFIALHLSAMRKGGRDIDERLSDDCLLSQFEHRLYIRDMICKAIFIFSYYRYRCNSQTTIVYGNARASDYIKSHMIFFTNPDVQLL